MERYDSNINLHRMIENDCEPTCYVPMIEKCQGPDNAKCEGSTATLADAEAACAALSGTPTAFDSCVFDFCATDGDPDVPGIELLITEVDQTEVRNRPPSMPPPGPPPPPSSPPVYDKVCNYRSGINNRDCYKENKRLTNKNGDEVKLSMDEAQAYCNSIGPDCIGLLDLKVIDGETGNKLRVCQMMTPDEDDEEDQENCAYIKRIPTPPAPPPVAPPPAHYEKKCGYAKIDQATCLGEDLENVVDHDDRDNLNYWQGDLAEAFVQCDALGDACLVLHDHKDDGRNVRLCTEVDEDATLTDPLQCVYFKTSEPPQSPPAAPPVSYLYNGPPVTPFAPCQCVDISDLNRCVCLPEESDGLSEYTIRRLQRHYEATQASASS